MAHLGLDDNVERGGRGLGADGGRAEGAGEVEEGVVVGHGGGQEREIRGRRWRGDGASEGRAERDSRWWGGRVVGGESEISRPQSECARLNPIRPCVHLFCPSLRRRPKHQHRQWQTQEDAVLSAAARGGEEEAAAVALATEGVGGEDGGARGDEAEVVVEAAVAEAAAAEDTAPPESTMARREYADEMRSLFAIADML